MVTGAVMIVALLLAAGHRREKRNLAGTGDHRIRLDMGVVDRGTDHPRRLECVGVTIVAACQPADQIADGADACRRLDGFLRLSHPLAHPGKILDLHPSSSSIR